MSVIILIACLFIVCTCTVSCYKRVTDETGTSVYNEKSRWDTSSIRRLPRYAVDMETRRNFYRSSNTNQSLLHEFVDCEKTNVKCDISFGTTGRTCTTCRRADTKCVRLTGKTRVKTRNAEVELPANSTDNPNEGYCLSMVDDATSTPNKQILSCNVNTADAILTTDNESRGYVLKCACKYPSLVTQHRGPSTDCDRPIACAGGRGKLVPKPGFGDWTVGTTYMGGDLKTSTMCTDCPLNTTPGVDLFGQPACLSTMFGDSFDDSVYKSAMEYATSHDNNGVSGDPYLVSDRLLPVQDGAIFGMAAHALDPDFVAQFSNNVRTAKRVVPNPCLVDGVSGKPFGHDECALYSAPGGDDFYNNDKRIYYCVPTVGGIISLQYEDDMLRNNGGRYANGCARIIDKSYKDVEATTPLTNSYLFEWFNRPREGIADPSVVLTPPVVGFNVNFDKLMPQVKRLFDTNYPPPPTASFYSSPVPDAAPVLPFPIDQRYSALFFEQQISWDTVFPSKCYFPYMFKTTQCALHGVRSTVPLPDCGALDREIPSITPFESEGVFWDFHLILDDSTYVATLASAFPACKNYVREQRYAFVPNYNLYPNRKAQHFTGMFIYNTKKRTLAVHWPREDTEMGNRSRAIDRYVKHLPALPPPPSL